MDERTQRWRQRGTVYLWRYVDKPKDYAGYHCSANADGLASMLELLEVMASAEHLARQTVQIAKPGEKQLTVPGYPGRAYSPTAWQIETSSTKYDGNHFEFSEVDGVCKLVLGSASLAAIAQEIRKLKQREGGDFCICSDDGDHGLWFWWQLT